MVDIDTRENFVHIGAKKGEANVWDVKKPVVGLVRAIVPIREISGKGQVARS